MSCCAFRLPVCVLLFLFGLGCEAEPERDGDDRLSHASENADVIGEEDTESIASTDSSEPIIEGAAEDDSNRSCVASSRFCEDGWVMLCDDKGEGAQKIENCEAQGLRCYKSICKDISEACLHAMESKSYIGCEYIASTFANSGINYDSYGSYMEDEPFKFAIAIANNNQNEAKITVFDNEKFKKEYLVPADEMIVIDDLPWKKELKEPFTEDYLEGKAFASRVLSNGAYAVQSDTPVTVYQFNPLQYQETTLNYLSEEELVYSYTNDASLLLPTHVFLDEYIAVARGTHQTLEQSYYYDEAFSSSPGFVAIVGSPDGPTTIEIRSTAYTQPSDDLSDAPFPALAPNLTMNSFTLAPLEVLQIVSATDPDCSTRSVCYEEESDYSSRKVDCCKTPKEYDITGTVIKVIDGPAPAVFAGHNCTFVPFDKWACDHLEQQMLPLKTWGTQYLCAHNITQHPDEPTIWRIVSGGDDNLITFYPEEVHEPVTLNKGEFIEFESLADFEVIGSDRTSVAQFMVGQNYTSMDENAPQNGDPAMMLNVPFEQFRSDYTFLAPHSYSHNYITVIHPVGEFPLLDGMPIAGDTREINDLYSRTNMEIEGGIHGISSDTPFGIIVYGVGRYTSYMYPGGLDLKEIPIV